MPMRQAAIDGLGIAFLPKKLIESHFKKVKLVEILSEWVPTFESYHFYYPSRKHKTTAFDILIEALRSHKDLEK